MSPVLTRLGISVNIEVMKIERTSVEERAARHAALADQLRLRIIDLLAFGDRSPGELRAVLGVSSNLLAHHLGVLEREGLIRRSRSAGDARRSYVTRVEAALRSLAAAPSVTPPITAATERVLFVCTGNSARSPVAAALWSRVSTIPACSAGTAPASRTSSRMIAVAKLHGVDISSHTPRDIRQTITDQDVVVTVCDRASERLGLPDSVHWSVPNPGESDRSDAYTRAFDELAARVLQMAGRTKSVSGDDHPIIVGAAAEHITRPGQ